MGYRPIFLLATVALAASYGFTALRQSGQSLNLGTLSELSPHTLLQSAADKNIFTPPPLRGSMTRPASTLTTEGILRETNKHRASAGLKSLTINQKLNQAANTKVADMFAQQYFEHVAPNGTTPAQLVEATGYQYLQTGENLALGNYGSEAELVQAWMDSPGHRENILKKGYNEIGIAAQPGAFENHRTWLTVQTFATNAATCPAPDTNLQSLVEETLATLEADNQTLTGSKGKLDSQKAALSALTSEINQLLDQSNAAIEQGNQKITEGNAIAQQQGPEAAQELWDEGEQLQQHGAELFQQVSDKEQERSQLQQEVEQIRTGFNSDVDTLNNLNQEVQRNADQLNQQIRTYNQCVSELNN